MDGLAIRNFYFVIHNGKMVVAQFEDVIPSPRRGRRCAVA